MSHGFYGELLMLKYMFFISEVDELQKCGKKLNIHDKHEFQ